MTLNGHEVACGLRDETEIGVGWDVCIRQDGELSFCRRDAGGNGWRSGSPKPVSEKQVFSEPGTYAMNEQLIRGESHHEIARDC
jgi:hypothetical protein